MTFLNPNFDVLIQNCILNLGKKKQADSKLSRESKKVHYLFRVSEYLKMEKHLFNV